ncbi:oxidoreductase [Actinoplanes sp. L3-i22]|uniref:oxidoreductase n=1 Tax=Actinoplanes sp. L3-i22 TaxID=2836373 RepID=UPI001C785347|nr:oxidoreductase [Actinoplanes sp. L3-i22]BCY09223.1 short-chain dehydrogenase [Actinoplanes sp. L3-i22]
MVKNVEYSSNMVGKRVLVTGGTRGIGAAVVRQFLQAGASVAVTSRTPVDDLPNGVVHVAADLGTVAGAQHVAEQAVAALGGLDVLINNAGAAQAYPQGVAAIPDQAWLDSTGINFLSSIRLTNALLPALTGGTEPAIVNISSSATLSVIPSLAHYAAAKAALESYTRALAAELAPRGVRVNVVVPGTVATDGGDQVRRDIGDAFGIPFERMNAGALLGRMGRPEDIAEAVFFLASGRAQWITGSTLVVDGGDQVR